MKPESIKPIYDPWNPVTWPREHFFWWSFFLLNMVFVWLTPLNVLDRYPQLVLFTDFMASWNMQIRRVGEISGSANQANRFCSSIIWCAMPIAWVRTLIEIHKNNPEGGVSVKSSLGFLCMLVVFPIFFYFAFWLIPINHAESSRVGRLVFLNTFGRGFFLPSYAYIIGFFILCWLWMVQAFLRGKLDITGVDKHGRR